VPDITAEVIAAGSAQVIYDKHVPPALAVMPGEVDPLEAAQARVDAWRSEGFLIVTVLDEDYPDRLRGVHQAPPLLFARGRLLPADRAISVVGSRKASERGRGIAGGIAAALAKTGVTVLSGLAAGIDTAAHTAALKAGGRTVAVIGTGIRGHYPPENRDLQERIAQEGLVLSQFLPDAPPRPSNFPMRNATMSGYGLATIVVEAGETSGARIQARVAVEHGRPVILTDLVVEQNKWARALVERPGVYVASNISEVLAVVANLLDEPDDLQDLMLQLTGQ
jgi:DNA processing protein